MEISQNDMNKLRKIELEILKAVIRTCGELNIKYYVLYGSLIGAIRHKGFIPWDDDIDIGMLREDYEVFVKEGQKYLPDYYFIQTHRTDPDYPMNFAKVRDSRTTFLESSIKDFRINHGVYIDIFPIDFYPEGKIRRIFFEFKKRLYRQRIRRDFTIPSNAEKKSWYSNFLMGLSRIILPSRQKTVDKLEDLFKSTKPSSLVLNNSGPWGRIKEIMPYSLYGKGSTVTFEGLNVNVPSEYEAWLRHMYGDYMKLPPKEKQKTHHFTEVIDLERSYLEYRND